MQILLSLGSSIGNRGNNIIECVNCLKSIDIKNIKVASIYETSPDGGVAKNMFYNTTICGEFKRDVFELFFLCKSIEFAIGRRKTIRWDDRIIDIDILLYGNKIIKNQFLEIPHPRFHLRKFVLVPAVEIASEFIHPVLKKSIYNIANMYKNFLDIKKIKYD